MQLLDISWLLVSLPRHQIMILVLFYLDPPIQSSFYFDPFVPAEVKDEIKVLPNNKAYGCLLYTSDAADE